jgi:hypothetical protein
VGLAGLRLAGMRLAGVIVVELRSSLAALVATLLDLLSPTCQSGPFIHGSTHYGSDSALQSAGTSCYDLEWSRYCRRHGTVVGTAL